MRLFHSTTPEAARAILAVGFRDGRERCLTDDFYEGVWLSDTPLDENEGCKGHFVLAVELDVPESALTDYEWVKEDWIGYREWLIPAEYVNAHATVTIEDTGEVEGGQ